MISIFVDENAKLRLYLKDNNDGEVIVSENLEENENENDFLWLEIKRDFSAGQLDEFQKNTTSDMKLDTVTGEAYMNVADIKYSNSLLGLSVVSWKTDISSGPEKFSPDKLNLIRSDIRESIVRKIEELYGIKRKK